MPTTMIRPTLADDTEPLMAILAASGQFDEPSLAHVRQTLQAHLAGEVTALWFTAVAGHPVGVAYCAPEPVTRGTWNLLMLWMHPEHAGQGLGRALVAAVEARLREQAVRLLIVETSALPEYQAARRFYEKSGFVQEARVCDFFDEGDDKLIYTRPLRPLTP
ncbi:MAG TPA: GNAT family N-acetyltransferase [Nevskiaceae bacterium]|nr:GNAT family N-acetyltransferase [Nevskiaceae bacterium]